MENKNLIQISGSTLIADCPLSTRVKSVLYYADIETIDDVLKESPHKLYRLRNFGTKSFLELNEFLIKNDFHFVREKQSNYQGMRTKFDISDGVFKGATLKQVYKEYETNLEDRGWIFDGECKEIYTIIDREIYLNVGAEIILYGLFYNVISKCYNVDEDYMHYELEAR